ncbi:flavin reductase family protein [Pelagibius sp. Alg239-R121]|uniref:flavin reductase family protein n=1 Tax=Pelagibius sp. Alg239-R121 TaxID=2993448 RepID=UPI0024A69C93|nr:flavin reductase family protein [Pelagibius sp. Alg239-R121]
MPQHDTAGNHPVPRDAFIRAMRTVASSVTVVTTDGPAGRHGATVSAFSSVSADPPTTLICLRTDSRIARAVSKNGNFCVNVLSRTNPEIANRFAGCDDDRVRDRFDGIDFDDSSGAAPEIDGATIFSCVVEQVVTSGSHSIFVGRVAAVRGGMAEPLAYLDGAYHRVVPQQATSGGTHRCRT